MAKEKKKPERIFRIGDVSCSVFLQEASDDRTFRTVNLQRSYVRDGKRQYGSSMTLAELPAAIEVLKMALRWIANYEGFSSKDEPDEE